MLKGCRVLAACGLAIAVPSFGCGARTALFLDDSGSSLAGNGSGQGGGSGAGQNGMAGGAACTNEDEQSCPSGFTCANGLCVTRCDSESDCREGYLCSGHVCAVRASYVIAGESHACVEVYDGSIHCWGDGSSGQLGNGASLASDLPVPVVGFPSPLGVRALELSAGGAFTCAWQATVE